MTYSIFRDHNLFIVKRTVHNWTWIFFLTFSSRPPFFILKNNNILLLRNSKKPVMRIGFRSQTWVTHVWNAILGYRGFEVPCQQVSLYTKWPKILCQKFQRFRSFEWPKDDGQCLRTNQLPEMVCAPSKCPVSSWQPSLFYSYCITTIELHK